MSAVTITAVRKSFGDQRVLDDVDLHVPNGSITSVLGASGCGKTTLLRIVAGFLRADGGTVTLGDRLVDDGETSVRPEKRGVGYVPQEGALFPHLDVAANILYGLGRRDRSTARLHELLELAELPADVAHRHPHELSGGQQQRVAIARALAPRPRVILLDEPFSSLDAALRVSAGRAVTRVLRHAGATAMIVTHDQGEALSLADQVAVMRAGRFVQVAPPSELYQHPVDPATAEFVGGASVGSGVVTGGVAQSAFGPLPVAAPDGPVRLMVRPEQVRLVPVDTTGSTTGKVEEVTYYGAQVVVRIGLTDGAFVTARGPSSRPPATGDVVGVVVEGTVVTFPDDPAPEEQTPVTVTDGSPGQRDLLDIGRYGDAPAVVLDDRVLTHEDLDRLVEQRCRQLGAVRRLVVVEGANELEPLVTYLAALRGRHPVLLVPAADGPAQRGQWQRLVSAYDPDVVLSRDGAGWTLSEVRHGTRHDLHPDLALLLGTSGSTGAPKLIRLSHDNLRSNAAAIAAYLDLGPANRAATTLPMHYCYGLSVVNSHLMAGGSLWLTGRSVVDDAFWDDFTANGATSFSGVPYTFELLERAAVEWAATPGLKQVTQAGGRLPAELVRAFALRGRRYGFDFVVMYGQTEATARMAYLPPHLAAARPSAIGIPINGGEFRLDDGELVYTGPNVMLGYAESAEDLALGRTVDELRTGDLAVQHDDGLYEIVGRRSRLAKLFGTRLDLDLAERLLADRGITARMVSDDRALQVFVREAHHAGPATETLTQTHCLPKHAVRVSTVAQFPTTSTGKPDYAALQRLDAPAEEDEVDVRAAYETVFGRRVSGSDTFVGLGGDSLSYVEMVVRLERALGTLPADWPRRTVAELAARRPDRSRRPRLFARLETPLLLRAAAIALIVGSHVELWTVLGGAHVLLVLFGYNLARFALAQDGRRARVRALGRTLRELLVPSVLWIGGVAAATGFYTWPTVLMLNGLVGNDHWDSQWQFWFLESAVWGTVGLALLTALPWADRLLRRSPFGSALAVLAGTLALRALGDGHAGVLDYYAVDRTVWCLALGWVIHAARGTAQRLVATALVPGCLHGFFPGDQAREWLIIGGVLLLVWVPHLPVPRPLDRALAVLATASLFVYLTHWRVYPYLEKDHQFLAWAASLVGGVAVWWAYSVARRTLARGFTSRARQYVAARMTATRRAV